MSQTTDLQTSDSEEIVAAKLLYLKFQREKETLLIIYIHYNDQK